MGLRIKKVALVLATVLLVGGVSSLQAATVLVSPGNMGSWSFDFNAGAGGSFLPCGACQIGMMVFGPGTPPLGVGSANLQTTPGNGDGASSIGTTSLNGVPLADLTALSYYTYDTVNNGQQFPYIQINFSYTNDINNDGPGTNTIFFEPPYQTPTSGNPTLPNQGPTLMNQWQFWNAFEGGWWDNNSAVGSPGAGLPPVGVAPLSAYLAFYTDPVIIGNIPYFPTDGLAITVGFASNTDNFNGNVDAVTIGVSGGNTTYNFDPIPAPSDTGFQVRYAANLNISESYIDITNTGANGAPLLGPGFGGASGNICVNVYAFDPNEELVSCCSCLVTPDQTVNLGVNADLTSKTLTGVVPTSVTVKLVATLAGAGGSGTSTVCNNSAASIAGTSQVVSGMGAFGTTLHATPPTGSYATTETPFTQATLSAAELASISGRCAAIIGNASGFGICTSCGSGALGASKLGR